MSSRKRLRARNNITTVLETANWGIYTFIMAQTAYGKRTIAWNNRPPEEIAKVINIYLSLNINMSLQEYINAALGAVDSSEL